MGQINTDSTFGQMIMRICSAEEYTTICEVGAWNGQGTTRCVMDALKNRSSPFTFFSLEANKQFFDKASNFWNPCPPELNLINGTLHNNIMTRMEVELHPLFESIKDHYYLWYDDEHSSCINATIFTLPVDTVDVVILDGGEFSTNGDWEVLKKYNPKIVALDDTNVIKTHSIRQELLNSPDWEVVFDVRHERNGWAIFKRRA